MKRWSVSYLVFNYLSLFFIAKYLCTVIQVLILMTALIILQYFDKYQFMTLKKNSLAF